MLAITAATECRRARPVSPPSPRRNRRSISSADRPTWDWNLRLASANTQRMLRRCCALTVRPPMCIAARNTQYAYAIRKPTHSLPRKPTHTAQYTLHDTQPRPKCVRIAQ
eukprot:7287918-Prymnesium_polylepis.1